MAHSYNTAHEYRDYTGSFGRRNPCPILTVANVRRDPGEETTFVREVAFYRSPTNELVINPWSGDVVFFHGEDLFALREFLAEFPEEAFVRPADPVSESYIAYDQDGDVWALNPRTDLWEPFLIDGDVYDFDDAYRSHGRGVDGWDEAFHLAPTEKKTRWTDGDKVLEVSDAYSWLRERIDGVWTVTKTVGGGITSQLEMSDERLSRYVDGEMGQHTYVVLRQQSEGVEL